MTSERAFESVDIDFYDHVKHGPVFCVKLLLPSIYLSAYYARGWRGMLIGFLSLKG